VEGRLLGVWRGLRSTSGSLQTAMEYYGIVYKALFAWYIDPLECIGRGVVVVQLMYM
jgi:hypothetical protein